MIEMMDLAAFSPQKLQLLNQSSPRHSARKRSLFPSYGPQSDDLGLISELCSDDSDVYSPPLVSPSSSVTSDKDSSSPVKQTFDKILKDANNLQFGNNLLKTTPIKASKKNTYDKENINTMLMSVKKSPKKSFRKSFMDKQNFEDRFITVFSDSPNKIEMPMEFEMKSGDSFTTPVKNTLLPSRSPHSASKPEVTIKPKSFYGNVAPMLATNQTNRIQGMKCVFRPPQPSKAKAKLLFEEKPVKKRERSKSLDAMREAKRRKPVFTGVHHAVPKPVNCCLSPIVNKKQESIREKVHKVTDLSRTFYRSSKKKKEGWEYTLRFTKPLRYEENLDKKRKFFKSGVKDPLCSSPTFSNGTCSVLPKKRKLFDSRQCYLEERSPVKPKINASDILDLIEDGEVDKLQEKPDVDEILLRLEEDDDEEEKKKEVERQMLMNIFEDCPTAIDSLSNCTASLDLNDSFSKGGCSRFDLDYVKENKTTPPQKFSLFNRSSSKDGVTNKGSSSKKKWHGVGEGQLQIDAGQKRYGPRQCPECGMLYQVGEAEDEMQHNAFHNDLATLRYTGWKNENIVGNFGTDYAIVITGDDPKSWQQKAIDVIALVDKSLGITSEVSVMHNQKVFLYISDKRIVGCMVANPVNRGYKMICSGFDMDVCSEETYTVYCGVSRMWTLFSHRRRGIASKLLDTVRCNFMYGSILPKHHIAFSIPTPDGKKFAAKYMDSTTFFVYVGY